MLRSLKIVFACFCLILGIERASGFALLGPFEAWQVPALGYDPTAPLTADIGGPHNLGEEYRWNTPFITYAYDQSFLDYFGTNGVNAIEAALAEFNELPPASLIPASLNTFPTETKFQNLYASALGLFDLKSMAMGTIIEQLGLTSAERYTWALRARTVIGTPAITNFLVIQRNFDPFTFQPTNYVNDVQLTYRIIDFDAPPADFEDAIEFSVDNPATPYGFTTVASVMGGIYGSLEPGQFFTGLTRDDIGGLRYLYNPNNINPEDVLPNTFFLTTNRNNLQFVTNINLTDFSSFTLTNNPFNLLGQFTNLIITSTNSFVGPLVTTNLVLTNRSTNLTFVNRENLILLTNLDFAVFTSLARTSPPALLTNLYPGLIIGQTNARVGILSTTNVTFTNGPSLTFTNFANIQIVTNQDLALLSSLSRTSAPAVLQALYPGLIITSTNSTVTTVVEVASVQLSIQYEPFAPPGFVRFQLITNYATNLLALYSYTYGNVVTNFAFNTTTYNFQTRRTEPEPWSDPFFPTFRTNVVNDFVTTNLVSGAFIIIPPGIAGYSYSGISATNVFSNTNQVIANTFVTNTFGRFAGTFALDQISDFVQVQYGMYPIQFLAPGNQIAVTNVVNEIVTFYDNTYANLVIQYQSDRGLVTSQFLTSSNDFRPGFPRATNVLSFNTLSNFVNGGFYIVPANIAGYEFTGIAITNITAVTNILVDFIDPVTLAQSQQFRIHYFTNVVSAVYPIEFVASGGFGNAVLETVLTTNLITFYQYTFGNVTTNFPTGGVGSPLVTLHTFIITNDPPGSVRFRTNDFYTLIPSPVPIGNIVIVDTNSFAFSGFQIATVTQVTNILFAFTNAITGEVVRREIIYPFTNIIYGVFPIETNSAAGLALRPGVDKITFIPVDRDIYSPDNLTFTTNIFYSGQTVTNNIVYSQRFQRIVSQADIVFTAGDLGTTTLPSPVMVRRTGTGTWINNSRTPANGGEPLAGPGTIQPTVVISFSKLGPSFLNSRPGFEDEENNIRLFFWGSFDLSTNAPIVYPQDISLQEVERRVLTGQ